MDSMNSMWRVKNDEIEIIIVTTCHSFSCKKLPKIVNWIGLEVKGAGPLSQVLRKLLVFLNGAF